MEHKQKQIQQQKHLPEDLIFEHILTRLPIKSLQEFKLVSKKWYSNISSDYRFAISHFKLSPFSHPSAPTQFLLIKTEKDYYVFCYDDYGDVDVDIDIDTDYGGDDVRMVKLETDFDTENSDFIVVGSCNGLVCLGDRFGYDFILWNPVTNQSKKYYSDPDDLDRFNLNTVHRVIWGFGYVSSIEDYKVVRVVEVPSMEDIIIHVFSLRLNKWSRIDSELYQHAFSLKTTLGFDMERVDNYEVNCYPRSFWSDFGKLVGETLYWVVAKSHVDGMNVVAFDLVLEKFFIFSDSSTNDGVNCREFGYDFLCVVEGCLCMRYVKDVGRRRNVWIRILKRRGDEECMCIERDLPYIESGHNLVGFTRTRKLFTLKRSGSQLCLIDPFSQRKKQLWKFEDVSYTRISSYAPSLIQPASIQFRSL